MPIKTVLNEGAQKETRTTFNCSIPPFYMPVGVNEKDDYSDIYLLLLTQKDGRKESVDI